MNIMDPMFLLKILIRNNLITEEEKIGILNQIIDKCYYCKHYPEGENHYCKETNKDISKRNATLFFYCKKIDVDLNSEKWFGKGE